MKMRESGMPEEAMWSGFFFPDSTLGKLGLREDSRDVVDIGCGYGTFSLPAARIVGGAVHALDIDAEMVETVCQEARKADLQNICAAQRDIWANGTGLRDHSMGYAMLFNILHCEAPETLTDEAYRILRTGGHLAIMHWNHDSATPRGPSMDIRPKPEQCRQWAEESGFLLCPECHEKIDLPPYHYGWVLEKP